MRNIWLISSPWRRNRLHQRKWHCNGMEVAVKVLEPRQQEHKKCVAAGIAKKNQLT